jgi:hypothetical protein
MDRKFRLIAISLLSAVTMVVLMILDHTAASANTQTPLFTQVIGPDTSVSLPLAVSRLNVGAIVAAALVALIIDLALNLLGLGIGMNSINPRYGEDSATPQELGTGAIAWVAITTAISLFIGGWLAGRFAGLPNDLDGLLHGLVTWALCTLVSVSLLATTAGRILSGTTTFLSQSLQLAGAAAGGVARGAAGVVQGVAQGAGNVVQGAAQGAGNAVQNVAQGAENAVEDAIQSRPEVANALRNRDQLMQTILNEGRDMLRQAGIDPNGLQGTAQGAVREATAAARTAVQNPAEAERIFSEALNRVLGQAQGTVNQVDRDAVVNVLAERGNISREQAQQTLAKWEDTFGRARAQAEQVAQQAQGKAEELRREAEYKAAEVRREADRVAREVANTTAKAISRLALAAFGAMLMGGIAASIGGALGAPDATTVTFNTTPPVVRPIDVVTSTPVSLTTPITPVP